MIQTLMIREHFDAAHYLPNYPGICNQLHGHRWRVEIGIKGRKDSVTGMVMDFSYLKTIVEAIILPLDHTCLNDYPELKNPTAENLVGYFHKRLNNHLELYNSNLRVQYHIKIDFIRIWETPNAYAQITITE